MSPNLSAVILAGGQSSRMGRDKAWLEVDGQPLLLRALQTVRELGVEEIFISGRAGGDYSALTGPGTGVRGNGASARSAVQVLYDMEPGRGPLGGIERALHAAAWPQVLVLAVDLPWMTSAFLRKLAGRCDALTGVVPLLDGEPEPLAAIYPRRCHQLVRDCLLQDRLSARDFVEACARERAVRRFSVPDANVTCFANWNRPSDISRKQPNSQHHDK
jgi:molybdopterin-guanine dinucleotide biosynthesis protein A